MRETVKDGLLGKCAINCEVIITLAVDSVYVYVYGGGVLEGATHYHQQLIEDISQLCKLHQTFVFTCTTGCLHNFLFSIPLLSYTSKKIE